MHPAHWLYLSGRSLLLRSQGDLKIDNLANKLTLLNSIPLSKKCELLLELRNRVKVKKQIELTTVKLAEVNCISFVAHLWHFVKVLSMNEVFFTFWLFCDISFKGPFPPFDELGINIVFWFLVLALIPRKRPVANQKKKKKRLHGLLIIFILVITVAFHSL